MVITVVNTMSKFYKFHSSILLEMNEDSGRNYLPRAYATEVSSKVV
jgi:hypothetical protein